MKSIGNCLRGFGTTLIVFGIVAFAGFTRADHPGGAGGGGVALDCDNIICMNACDVLVKPVCCNEGHGQCDHCICKWAMSIKWCEVGCPD